jgi:predicted methyltransferase
MKAILKASLKPLLVSLMLAGGLSAIAAETVPSALRATLKDTARPKADTDRDALRKPAELMAFAGIKPGDKVADLMPGGGYFTRLFSKAVGPKGQVYPITPSNLDGLPERFAEILTKNVTAMQELAKGYSNVTPLALPLDQIAAKEPLDLVWTAQNYHDIYGYFSPEAAAATNAAIFKALKKGGIYLVIDHVAGKGTGLAATTKLHRIDPELVKKQVLAAGFVFAGESKVLHNPKDKLGLIVFDPSLRGHTDQFVFKFRKP